MTDEAERLYGLPLEEFTAARDALVRELRAEDRADDAKEVAALRKPVLAAWVVNRLARDEREEMRKLIGAAEEIRRGEAGADGRFRASLDRLTGAARELLQSRGHSPDAVVQQVARTLRAGAAGSPDALAAGMLTKPLEASGFGAMAGAKPAGATKRNDPSPKRQRRVDRARLEKARRAAEEAREEARALERAAREAERAARAAHARAEAARKKVTAAERRVAEARGR